jgi:hypothetical protein
LKLGRAAYEKRSKRWYASPSQRSLEIMKRLMKILNDQPLVREVRFLLGEGTTEYGVPIKGKFAVSSFNTNKEDILVAWGRRTIRSAKQSHGRQRKLLAANGGIAPWPEPAGGALVDRVGGVTTERLAKPTVPAIHGGADWRGSVGDGIKTHQARRSDVGVPISTATWPRQTWRSLDIDRERTE